MNLFFKNFKEFLKRFDTLKYINFFLKNSINNFKNLFICKLYILYCINAKKDRIFLLSKKKVLKVYPKINSHLYDLQLPNYLSKKNKPKKTTAVIFNSSLINFQNKGHEIDSHDNVIRINLGTGKFNPNHLGNKTTFRILGKNWIYFDDKETLGRTYNNNEYYLNDVKNLENNPNIFKNGIFIFDNELMKFYTKIFNGMMSNGMRSVLLGLSISDKVFIYGHEPKKKNFYKKTFIGNSSHYPNINDKEYFMNWNKMMNIKDGKDQYFQTVSVGLSHNLYLEYFFYRNHPRVNFA